MMSVNYYNDNDKNGKYDTLIGIGIVLALIASCWMLSGCSTMGWNAGRKTAEKYYADDDRQTIQVSPLKQYGYSFMRGWESYKLEKARNAR